MYEGGQWQRARCLLYVFFRHVTQFVPAFSDSLENLSRRRQCRKLQIWRECVLIHLHNLRLERRSGTQRCPGPFTDILPCSLKIHKSRFRACPNRLPLFLVHLERAIFQKIACFDGEYGLRVQCLPLDRHSHSTTEMSSFPGFLHNWGEVSKN